jgi:hypothetical protein
MHTQRERERERESYHLISFTEMYDEKRNENESNQLLGDGHC